MKICFTSKGGGYLGQKSEQNDGRWRQISIIITTIKYKPYEIPNSFTKTSQLIIRSFALPCLCYAWTVLSDGQRSTWANENVYLHSSAPYFHCPRWPSCLFYVRWIVAFVKVIHLFVMTNKETFLLTNTTNCSLMILSSSYWGLFPV